MDCAICGKATSVAVERGGIKAAFCSSHFPASRIEVVIER